MITFITCLSIIFAISAIGAVNVYEQLMERIAREAEQRAGGFHE